MKKEKKRNLRKKFNAIGIWEGTKIKDGWDSGKRCLTVAVLSKMDKKALLSSQLVPETLNGLPTDVIQIDKVKALTIPDGNRMKEWRPAPGGVSIGHYAITAGTLGVVTKDSEGKRVILSNNHVLANSNKGKIGDDILQPGPYDAGTGVIAKLEKFIPIEFEDNGDGTPQCPIAKMVENFLVGVVKLLHSRYTKVSITKDVTNLVDAALALPLVDTLVTEEILAIGFCQGWKEASIGMDIHKSGRSISYNQARVIGIDGTIAVEYDGETAIFDDQIITTKLADPGDSGSLVLGLDDNKAVGLLFAGSEQVTILGRIKNVMDLLNISF